MKKVNKTQSSKKGFTMVEVILIIAIIVILASVLIFNINDIINAANNADDAVADASDKLGERIDASENLLKKYSF